MFSAFFGGKNPFKNDFFDDDDDFGSFGGFGGFSGFKGMGGMDFNFSSMMGGGSFQGTSTSTTTQIINGKKITKTVTTTVDKNGKKTQKVREEADGHVKEYLIENRLMLIAGNYKALNDIVIKGLNCSRTSTLDLYINDKKLCSYVADGLIVATPTGSTAYSLSAGGPIISPSVDCFLIIPICPHTLNTRPIVIPSNEKITIKTFEENQKLNISFDGQVDIVLDNEIKIEKNENIAKLLILSQQKDKFYDILKEKLHWSLSPKK